MIPRGTDRTSAGNRQDQRIPDDVAGRSGAGPQDGENTEDEEDIHIAQCVVFQERVKDREQDARSTDPQHRRCAEQNGSRPENAADHEQDDAHAPVLRRLKVPEHQIGYGKGLLIVHAAAEIRPVAQQVPCGMEDDDT